MIKVNETIHDQPDVSKVRPVYVPANSTRSYTVQVTFINDRGKYQQTAGYWDDIEKCWRHESNGYQIQYEVVKSDPLPETEKHYDDALL